MRILPFLFVSVLGASPALASGGLSCAVDDDAVTLSITSGMTHGMGSPLFDFSGTVEIRDARVRDALRETHFERDHVPQYWFDGEQLMLRLYRETIGDEPHAYVELAVRAIFDDAGEDYRGDYAITVYDMAETTGSVAQLVELTGPVSCLVG